jgi:hypothetical protein
MKKCTKCLEEKCFTLFFKNKQKNDGYSVYCKSCEKSMHKKNRKMSSKQYYYAHHERCLELSRIRRRIKKSGDIILNVTGERIKKEYNYKNIAERIEKKEIISASYEKYKPRTKEEIKKYNREWASNKRKTDPLYKLKYSLRSLVYGAFKRTGHYKNSKTESLLGVSVALASKHIERQFKKGMTWENHGRGKGKWHIDHKRPISSAKNIEDLKILLHYTNLQPLWSSENIKKSNKLVEHQLKITI